MKPTTYCTVAAALLFSSAAFAQIDIQLRLGRQPGWNAQAREGHCEVRLWVDKQADLRMRGESVAIQTRDGGRSYDEGSACSSPMPYSAMGNFQIRQTAGRNKLTLRQAPNRENSYTAVVAIEDRQGGGDHYAFEATWRADGNGPNIPPPYFDDIRACQDNVRQRFLAQNGRDSYIDFDGIPTRQPQKRNREVIQGRGDARSRRDERELTYSCEMDTRTGLVRSATFHYSGQESRGNGRNR